MVIRRVVGVLAALALALPLAACDYTARAKGSELCGRYDELANSVEKLKAEDPRTAKAEDLRDAVEGVQDQLDQLQAVSEGRLDSALTTLRSDLSSELESAVDAGSAELKDALQNVSDTWARVQVLAAVQCGTD
jgi:hypothetical protein